MTSVLRSLLKQGIVGWITAFWLVVLLLIGGISVAVGLIDFIWWSVAVRTFGAPALDYLAGLGVLLALLIVALIVTLIPGRAAQEESK